MVPGLLGRGTRLIGDKYSLAPDLQGCWLDSLTTKFVWHRAILAGWLDSLTTKFICSSLLGTKPSVLMTVHTDDKDPLAPDHFYLVLDSMMTKFARDQAILAPVNFSLVNHRRQSSLFTGASRLVTGLNDDKVR